MIARLFLYKLQRNGPEIAQRDRCISSEMLGVGVHLVSSRQNLVFLNEIFCKVRFEYQNI